ncbi:unnamed protein product [Brachionus calyciflorus]|uniref:LRAT domain-containing protein n=1 Tax=Brachionus calyciflorus TaxID=104777 RepID=A0A813UEH7_9BILA|nr:unnamed protein product [Brachionus calyciflorus]
MQRKHNFQELINFLGYSEDNIGYLLGITDTEKKKWSLAIYIGNDSLMCLYDETKGINNLAFNDLLKIGSKLKKESLKNLVLSNGNLKRIYEFGNDEFEFACYKFNLIDICLEKGLVLKSLLADLEFNLNQIHALEEGDAVSFERGFYSHHAILTDKAHMIVTHKWGEPENLTGALVSSKSLIGIPIDKACVTEDFIIEVAGYRKLKKINHLYDRLHKPKPKDEILREAKRRLGELGYSVTINNCQNFVSEVRNGESISPEVEAVKTGALYTAVAGTILSGLYLASKTFGTKNKEKEKTLQCDDNET